MKAIFKSLVFLLAMLVCITSCEKKETDIFTMKANLNGKDVDLKMHSLAIKGILKDVEGKYVSQTYQISGLGSISFIMRAADSTMTKDEFDFKDMEECLIWDENTLFQCIDARLRISEEEDRLLKGEFAFVGVKDMDTVRISDGFFQMTLDVSVGYEIE